jgi:hypothetical protein
MKRRIALTINGEARELPRGPCGLSLRVVEIRGDANDRFFDGLSEESLRVRLERSQNE